jgi:ankyrin repeat protein
LFKYANDNCTTDDQYRNTPLTYAAVIGNVEVVRVLLEGGANVESTNDNRRTALHRAAYNGHLDVCRLLLDWGAKVDPVDVLEETPLHDAARQGHLSVVQLLVERGADVSIKSKSGNTAMDLARINGKKDLAEWLYTISHG